MANRRHDPEVLKAALAAVETFGSISRAARELHIPYPTFQGRVRAARFDQPQETPFVAEKLPDAQPTAAELLSRRRTDYARKAKSADARRLIRIHIKTPGPIGIAHFGDPHIDDDGTNIALLEQHVGIVNRTDGLFAANVGDFRNNWIGRLARLWSDQGTSASEALVLVKWLMTATPWLYLVGGNHDAWSGADDPLAWISEQVNAIYQPFAARIELLFPNGRKVRINARHDFKGHSEWNAAHGVAKAARIGWRDHLLTCGHRHVSGYNVLKDPSTGLISHAIRVASYKLHDRFAIEQGLPDQNIFVCPVTVIDPSRPDDDPGCITTIFEPETGADFLTFLRNRGGHARRAHAGRGRGRGPRAPRRRRRRQ